MNYYNDNDKAACSWLRELIADGLIPDGKVDDRSIMEVSPDELEEFTQCHFFAGIGGWPYALRLAGWPDDRPVWTGSCPCQPFSVAGSGGGLDDDRHLWPAFRWLVAQCRPECVFGEQVASKAGRSWMSGVRADLAAMGYGCGPADLCSAGVGSPNIRQRLFWVADTGSKRRGEVGGDHAEHDRSKPDSNVPSCGMADSTGLHGPQHEREPGEGSRGATGPPDRAECRGDYGRVADTANDHRGRRECRTKEGTRQGESRGRRPASRGIDGGVELTHADRREQAGQGGAATGGDGAVRAGSVDWTRTQWHQCRDGKQRRIPIEPAFFPLATGLPGRVGLLRGAGNAINPVVAATFIKAYIEIRG